MALYDRIGVGYDATRHADQAKHHARHPDHENFLAQGGFVTFDLLSRILRDANIDRDAWIGA